MNTTIQTADVIVIGGGISGLVTAFELLNRNRKVILIDRDREANLGGLAKLAFGGMALVGTPLQRRMGIEDNPEIALRDWYSFAEFGEQDVWPKKWAEYYVSRSVTEVYEWLAGYKLGFLPAVNWVERGLYTPGNSVPRYHVLWGTGHALSETFVRLLREHHCHRNLTLLFQHRVNSFVWENGAVRGCQAVDEQTGIPRELHADHTVVATGGITGDLKQVRNHWNAAWGRPPEEMLNGSHPFADGKVHNLVTNLGGQVTHLDKMWNYAAGIPHPKPRFPDQGLSLIPCKSALWLDHTGKRIGPDPLVTGFDTHYLCRRVAEQAKPFTWQVMNWKIAAKELAISGSEHNPSLRDKKPFRFAREILFGNHRLIRAISRDSDHVLVADGLRELVAKMNRLNGNEDIHLDNLRQEIEAYDRNLQRGQSLWNDDQIRRIVHARQWRSDRLRTCKPQPILDKAAGPLIAMKLRLITRKSLGGIQTDLQSRVLSRTGEPIPGLLAVGEAAGFGGGGASGCRSLEGTFLSGCILTARAAARFISNQHG